MITSPKRKGIVLMVSYFVVLVLLTLTVAFFSRAIYEQKSVQRHDDFLKALYNAEKAVAYAYYESGDKGWAWYTHKWDAPGTSLLSENLTTADALRTQGANVDCFFQLGGPDDGCYIANDGSFVLKTFPDPNIDNVTVVRAKGISNQLERVVEYRIAREPIFDFAWWTPYNLYLDNIGNNVNGGRIHSNGNIWMRNSKRLYGVDTLSTGKDKSIYYAWNTYYAPGYYDWYMDGSSNINGEVPLPHLDTPRRWAGTGDEQGYGTQHPWKYLDSSGDWRWRRYGSEYAGSWPPRDWRDEDSFFYGCDQARYNQAVDAKEVNYYNTWIYPAQKDAAGDIAFDASGNVLLEPVEQIPAELEGAMWDWEKYYNFSGTFGGSSQQELKFTIYDPDNPQTPKYVEDTRWKIEAGEVVMTGLDDPAGITYWAMLQDYNYWKAIGYSDDDAETWGLGADNFSRINQELLDGTYASEVPAGQNTIQVDNTNSMKQQQAWNDFLANSDHLEGVLLANERGQDIEPPRFATTYQEKSQKAGLYLSKSAGSYTLKYGKAGEVSYTVSAGDACAAYSDYGDPNDYWACLEDSIDLLVKRLNTDAKGVMLGGNQKAARKVKFINTYTNQTNTVLELDLHKMETAGTFPANGIIYSEVPVRLANANQLPYTGNPKKATFNLICEENIYLKGDYNNPSSDIQWMPSAIISKKFIYELSDSFNDPGWQGYDDGFSDTLSSNTAALPAFRIYPNYPYVYAQVDGAGQPILTAGNKLIEADPSAGGGGWLYYGNYLSGTAEYNATIALRNEIQNAWWATFDQNDPTGMQTYITNTGHPIIDNQEWGAMPNRVESDTTYNCLMASYWNNIDDYGNDRSGIPTGALLERWISAAQYNTSSASYMDRTMNGAYFQLDAQGFTALSGDGVDLVDIPLDTRPASRPYYSNYWGPYYQGWDGHNPRSYDSRFRNALLAQNRPIFLGGGQSSWREIETSAF